MISHHELVKQVPDINKVSIRFREMDNKGLGIFAAKTIQKGDVIAYYKVKVFREKTYESPTNFVYTFDVYRKNGDEYKRLIGDIDSTCFPAPGSDNIPYWGAFVNEPSPGQKTNSEIDIDLAGNYKNRTHLKAGDTVVYKLVATKRIRKGSEILWYYGDNYKRDYKVGKE